MTAAPPKATHDDVSSRMASRWTARGAEPPAEQDEGCGADEGSQDEDASLTTLTERA